MKDKQQHKRLLTSGLLPWHPKSFTTTSIPNSWHSQMRTRGGRKASYSQGQAPDMLVKACSQSFHSFSLNSDLTWSQIAIFHHPGIACRWDFTREDLTEGSPKCMAKIEGEREISVSTQFCLQLAWLPTKTFFSVCPLHHKSLFCPEPLVLACPINFILNHIMIQRPWRQQLVGKLTIIL